MIQDIRRMINKVQEKISFHDAAESHIPAEKIKKFDAPPTPKSLQEAISGIFGKYFKKAMLVEIKSLEDKGVWEIVPKPKDKKLIRSKWVYAYKTDQDDYITRFKARLVAQGFSQVEGEDYDATFAPVVKIRSVRLLLALALHHDLHIEQLDVETAYLYGELQIPNYMKMPPGFEQHDSEGRELVCKLVKSLYGLHQSGREWFDCLTKYLKSIAFDPLKTDPCLFSRDQGGERVILSLYVDDVISVTKNAKVAKDFKHEIRNRFAIVDGGEANWVLKIQIERFDDGIFLVQMTYAEEILRKANLWDFEESKEYDTPMMTTWTHDPTSPDLSPVMQKWYHSFVMKIAYLSQNTRPDLAYAANVLAQWQSKANESDLRALHRTLKYVKHTYDYGLWYAKKPDYSGNIIFSQELDIDPLTPMGYADASYANEIGFKSRSGYAFFVNGSLINWFSKKQPVVALSSTEAEIISFSESVKESLCLRQLVNELNGPLRNPTTIAQDNQSAIAICLDPIQHARVKHMNVRQFFVRDHLANKEIKMIYCPTEEMIADIFTKALPRKLHWKFMDLLGMRSKRSLDTGHRKVVKMAIRVLN